MQLLVPSELPYEAGQSPFGVRGLAYRGVIGRLDERFGRSTLVEGFRTPAERRFFSQPFMAATLYDTFPMLSLSARGAELTGQSADAFCRESAGLQAQEDLSGVYRALLAVLHPELVLRAAVKISKRYFNFGGTELQSCGEGRARLVRSGVPSGLTGWYRTTTEAYLEVLLRRVAIDGVQITSSTARAPADRGVACSDVRIDVTWRD